MNVFSEKYLLIMKEKISTKLTILKLEKFILLQ